MYGIVLFTQLGLGGTSSIAQRVYKYTNFNKNNARGA